MQIALNHIKIVSGGLITTGKAILVNDKQIAGVVAENNIPQGYEQINGNGCWVAPGLIDLQVYGSGGQLFSEIPTIEALVQMESDFIQEGTTGFLATVATNSNEVIEQAIDAACVFALQTKGTFLGLHLEGPYLNAKRKGAHLEKYIKKAALAELTRWVQKGNGIIRLITLAPELQDKEVIDYLNEQGIVISAGHTDASYDEAIQFFNSGIQAATHLYNAMPPIHHRQPGIIPAIYDRTPYTSIVADGIHVSYPMIKLAKQLLKDKLFLITDAVTETNNGQYHHVFKTNHYEIDGVISGSALTMLKAVENCVTHAGIDLPEAVNMASLYPARLLSKAKKGKIEVGFDADMIIFNDKFTPAYTVLQGKIIQHNETN